MFKIKNIVKKLTALTLTVVTVLGSAVCTPVTEVQAGNQSFGWNADHTDGIHPDEVVPDEVKMYRLFNPNSGEHFYTRDNLELCDCINAGWRFEGLGWMAPTTNKSDVPVYRVYNPNSGIHHYTINQNEYDSLVHAGWKDEGIAWYSSTEEGALPLYREYNPATGQHNYTTEWGEHAILVTTQGWNDEGIAWYGNANSLTEKANFKNTYGYNDYPSFGLLDTFIYLGNYSSTKGEKSHFYYYFVLPDGWWGDDVSAFLSQKFGWTWDDFVQGEPGLIWSAGSYTANAKKVGHFAEGDVYCVPLEADVHSNYCYYQIENHRSLYTGYYRQDLPYIMYKD